MRFKVVSGFKVELRFKVRVRLNKWFARVQELRVG
jgi:hypothetical protein